MPIEPRVGFHVYVLRVLDHQQSIWCENAGIAHQSGQQCGAVEIERRISENDVVHAAVTFHEGERITFHMVPIGGLQRARGTLHVYEQLAVLFHTDHLFRFTAQELQRNASRAGEQIENADTFQRNGMVKDVEEALFREIGGRPSARALGRKDPAPFVFAAYDAHENCSSKGMKW